jgi:hypothetical protein
MTDANPCHRRPATKGSCVKLRRSFETRNAADVGGVQPTKLPHDNAAALEFSGLRIGRSPVWAMGCRLRGGSLDPE